MISIKNISKNFGGVKAVDNCSFNIEKGSITGLIGPNGAGKTTLFNIMAGFLKPDSGSIFFDNENISIPKERTLRKVSFCRVETILIMIEV